MSLLFVSQQCQFVDGKCVRCGVEREPPYPKRNCRPGDDAMPPLRGQAASACLPGTELKKLLAKFGLKETADCACKSRAAFMDRQGCEWVEANVDTVVGWLREEAEKRGLPFVDAAGKMLVREALRRARKDAAARAQRPPRDD